MHPSMGPPSLARLHGPGSSGGLGRSSGLDGTTGLPAAVRDDVAREVARRRHRGHEVVGAVLGLLVLLGLLPVTGVALLLILPSSVPTGPVDGPVVVDATALAGWSTVVVVAHLLLVAATAALAGVLATARHRRQVRAQAFAVLAVLLGPLAGLVHVGHWVQALVWAPR